MKPVLSPKEVAEAIGVSESSLKRWADEGRIRVSRTAGGHRRIPAAEAIRFIRATHSPLVRPDILGLTEVAALAAEPLTAETDDERLLRYLGNGQAAEARGLILSLYLAGQSVAAISDGPLRHAMEHIGGLWRDDPAGILVEHRATDICVRALGQLLDTLPRQDNAPVAVGGAPEGDTGQLASLIAATVLAAEGFHAVNLGGQTPLDALWNAATLYPATLVWLSVTHAEDIPALGRQIDRLAGRLTEIGAQLVVGGRQAEALRRSVGPQVYVGNSMGELAALARGLLGRAAAS